MTLTTNDKLEQAYAIIAPMLNNIEACESAVYTREACRYIHKVLQAARDDQPFPLWGA